MCIRDRTYTIARRMFRKVEIVPRRIYILRTPLLASKIPRAHGGCLGIGSRRRTRQAAIISGEGHTPCDPEVSEWGNPLRVMPEYPRLNQIGRRRTTRGTETSKYPEEEKSNEIARVAASGSARAQTHVRASAGRCHVGVAGARTACPVKGGGKGAG